MNTKETITLIIALIAVMGITAQAEIFMDYDDGVVDGVHDVAVRDGDFTNTTVAEGTVIALFSEMPNWTQVELLNTWLPNQTAQASKTDLNSGVGSDRNAILTAPTINTHAQSLDYIPTGGETYNISFMWRDAWNWVREDWTVKLILYTTGTDEVHTWATNVVVCESGLSVANNSYQTETFTGTITVPPASVGKNLFVAFESSDQTTTNTYARLDNIFIEILPYTPVTAVSPDHKETAIPYSGIQLEWTVDNDWACDVNFGVEPNDLQLSDYAGEGEGVYTYDTGALEPSTTYCWSIDAIDPNGNVRVPGPFWNFTTADPTPVIDADPNAYAVVYAGEDAVYDIVAHNPGTGDATDLTYQWYKYVDGVSDIALSDGADYTGTTTVEMTVLAADLADQGEYYCVVTLGTGTAASLNAVLGIKALEAHWTMDEADYVGGLYLDSSGNGHSADPNGEWVPTFTEGADGTTATGAVTIDPATGWAQAGTWNPSANTNSLTLSAWIYWDGTVAGNGIVAKRDAFGTDNNMWQLTLNDTGGLWLVSGGAGGGDSSWTVNAGILPNEWRHVCATVDWDGSAAIYVDGVLLETFTFLMGSKTDSPVIIGVADTDPLTVPFNGSLDDIRIYNYALTLEEVIADYYATSGIGVCLNRPALDLTGPEGEPDCWVNIHDFALMAADWLGCGLEPLAGCSE